MAESAPRVIAATAMAKIAPERCPQCAEPIGRISWTEDDVVIRYYAGPCGHQVQRFNISAKIPRHGSETELYLRSQRDAFPAGSPQWETINDALLNYRAQASAARTITRTM